MTWRTIVLLVLTVGVVVVVVGSGQVNMERPNPQDCIDAHVTVCTYAMLYFAQQHAIKPEQEFKVVVDGKSFGCVYGPNSLPCTSSEAAHLQQIYDGKPEPKPVQREDCERFYIVAKQHAVTTPAVDSTANRTYTLDHLAISQAYATMYLACRARNR